MPIRGRRPDEALAAVADIPVGGAVLVREAAVGDPLWVTQYAAGKLGAFDARCPHQGCTVNFVSPADGFTCPCHGSRFTAGVLG